MNKHTPGPWHRDGNRVYTFNSRGVNHLDVQVFVGNGWAPHKEEQEHDAALIAAAPDLLKLAEALVQSWEACADGAQAIRHNDGTIINVRALIARATGEP